MTITDWIQAISMVVLVVVTGIYAWRTHVISKATKAQADASVKMAEEMREQRVMASRPVIIQKAIYEKDGWTDPEIQFIGIEISAANYFSHFEVYNAGNGPAIEVEISLLNKEKNLIHSQRKTFIRASEPPIEFYSSELASLEESTCYLVSEYQSTLFQEPKQMWYQTWLPLQTNKASKEGKIFVVAGELEFKEVLGKEHIDAFGSGSKPK